MAFGHVNTENTVNTDTQWSQCYMSTHVISGRFGDHLDESLKLPAAKPNSSKWPFAKRRVDESGDPDAQSPPIGAKQRWHCPSVLRTSPVGPPPSSCNSLWDFAEVICINVWRGTTYLCGPKPLAVRPKWEGKGKHPVVDWSREWGWPYPLKTQRRWAPAGINRTYITII